MFIDLMNLRETDYICPPLEQVQNNSHLIVLIGLTLMVLLVNVQLLRAFLTLYILYTWGAKDPNSVKILVAFNCHISTLSTPAKTHCRIYFLIYFKD